MDFSLASALLGEAGRVPPMLLVSSADTLAGLSVAVAAGTSHPPALELFCFLTILAADGESGAELAFLDWGVRAVAAALRALAAPAPDTDANRDVARRALIVCATCLQRGACAPAAWDAVELCAAAVAFAAALRADALPDLFRASGVAPAGSASMQIPVLALWPAALSRGMARLACSPAGSSCAPAGDLDDGSPPLQGAPGRGRQALPVCLLALADTAARLEACDGSPARAGALGCEQAHAESGAADRDGGASGGGPVTLSSSDPHRPPSAPASCSLHGLAGVVRAAAAAAVAHAAVSPCPGAGGPSRPLDDEPRIPECAPAAADPAAWAGLLQLAGPAAGEAVPGDAGCTSPAGAAASRPRAPRTALAVLLATALGAAASGRAATDGLPPHSAAACWLEAGGFQGVAAVLAAFRAASGAERPALGLLRLLDPAKRPSALPAGSAEGLAPALAAAAASLVGAEADSSRAAALPGDGPATPSPSSVTSVAQGIAADSAAGSASARARDQQRPTGSAALAEAAGGLAWAACDVAAAGPSAAAASAAAVALLPCVGAAASAPDHGGAAAAALLVPAFLLAQALPEARVRGGALSVAARALDARLAVEAGEGARSDVSALSAVVAASAGAEAGPASAVTSLLSEAAAGERLAGEAAPLRVVLAAARCGGALGRGARAVARGVLADAGGRPLGPLGGDAQAQLAATLGACEEGGACGQAQ